jgi:hypothetical protein
MGTYKIVVVLGNRTTVDTQFEGMELEAAKAMLQTAYRQMEPEDGWASLAVLDDDSRVRAEVFWG